jgi:glycosyltransferase involved in cell wall biosynthesis
MEQWRSVRLALVVTGGVDRSGRHKVIPALLWLIGRLARRHELFVYVLRYHGEPCTYPLLGATVRDLGRPRGLPRQYGSLIAALRRDGPFDVVHGYWALPAGLVAAAAGRRLSIPSIVTCDSGEFVSIPDIDYGLQRRWRHRRAVTATLKLASRVTVCTTYMERLAREHGTTALVSPLGVDTALFSAAAPPVEGPPWRLLHVASLNPVKDQRVLIDAFRRVVDRIGDVRLDVAGEDTLGGTVQAYARQVQVDDRVSFHGVLPSDRLTELYRGAHLFVLSSRHEAAGVVALEAAACGVPVVGTSVGYVADWSPERAVAAAPANPAALADAIVTLLGDPGGRARLAASAREWALAHDADWTAAQFERLYASM